MRVNDVTEEQARGIRCAFCAAQRSQPCTTATVRRVITRAALKRSHRQRRRDWLAQRERRNSEETVGD